MSVPLRMSISSVLVANMNTNQMKIPIRLQKEGRITEVKALVDLGVQGKFIYRDTVRRLGLCKNPLAKPIKVYNVDGTPNELGNIRNKVVLPVTINGRTKNQELLVTQLGKQEVILGMNWPKENNPIVDWKKGTLEFYPHPQDEEMRRKQEHLRTIATKSTTVKVSLAGGAVPKYGTAEAAGMDLSTKATAVVLPGQRTQVPTRVRLRPPEGTYARIAPQSSLAMKGIDVKAGVID